MAVDPTGDDHIDIWDLDEWGINLSLSLIRRPPGMWTDLANGQPTYAFGHRGIEKRGGLLSFHSTALGASVLAMADVPLGSAFDVGVTERLIAGLREDTPLGGAYFTSSTDGTTWAAYSSLTKASVGWLPGFTRESAMNYVSELAGAVTMQRWNGTSRYPVISSFPKAVNGDIYAFTYINGVAYFIVNADTVPAGTDVYYVYIYYPETGVISQLGGTNLTHSVLGAPSGIAVANGEVFVVGAGSGLQGVVYKYAYSGGVGAWVLDEGPAVREFYGGIAAGTTSAVLSTAGRLIIAMAGNGVTIPGQQRERISGVWTTTFTCPNNDESIRGFAAHGSVVLTALSNPSNAAVRIYADGIQELNVVSTYGATNCVPGDWVVWGGNLYWAWFRPGSVLLQGFILKRTAAGVWSQADTGRALNGFLGLIE